MSYLLVFAIVLALMGSVFWIMPSPAEKRKMLLRNHAIQNGYVVKYVMGGDADVGETNRPLISYAITSDKLKLEKAKSFDVKLLKGERPDEKFRVALLIDAKPEAVEVFVDAVAGYEKVVEKIRVSSKSLTLIWQENGDTESLEKMLNDIKDAWCELRNAV